MYIYAKETGTEMTTETKKLGNIVTDTNSNLHGMYMSESYGMFTEEGDILVQGIVDVAKGTDADWPWVYEKLEMLGKTEGFEEATDTMVREAVFDAIGYGDDVSFWV